MRSHSGFLSHTKTASPEVSLHPDPPTVAVSPERHAAALFVGIIGVAVYNWWIVVALQGQLITSPDELFSDLEAAGRPDAALLQHLDLAAGLLLLAALLLRGPLGPRGRRAEWPWLVAFTVAGAVGGKFSYACPEGLSAGCRSAEWRLALPPHHYAHVLSGIVEFATVTVAIYVAWQRTRPYRTTTAFVVRWLSRALVVAYPVLGFAYLTDRIGAFVEPVFFLCFTVMILVELVETDQPVSPAGMHAPVAQVEPDGGGAA